MPPEVRVIGINGMPEFKDGDDLAGPMMDAAESQGTPLGDGDILVVTQKIISKVEGKVVSISDVEASPLAISITEGHRRDPRHTEWVLRESKRIVRMDRGVIISETKHGFYCANAGIDAPREPSRRPMAGPAVIAGPSTLYYTIIILLLPLHTYRRYTRNVHTCPPCIHINGY